MKFRSIQKMLDGKFIHRYDITYEAQDGSTNHILTVAGVIDKEGQCLLTFTQSGEIERVAVRFRERFQIKERMKELLSSGSQGAWGSITLFGSGFSSANARSDTSYRRSGN